MYVRNSLKGNLVLITLFLRKMYIITILEGHRYKIMIPKAKTKVYGLKASILNHQLPVII